MTFPGRAEKQAQEEECHCRGAGTGGDGRWDGRFGAA